MSTAPYRSFLFDEGSYAYFNDDSHRGHASAKHESGYIGSIRTDRLTDIFNKFANDALRDYPKLRGSFMLIDGKTGEAIGEVAPDKLNGDAEDVAAYFAEKNYGGYADTVKIDAEMSDIVHEGELYAIRYNMFMPISGNAEQDLKFSLRHELGHAVVPGAIDMLNINYSEMAGDVFAMLNHIREYGDEDGSYLTLLARKRTEGLLMGDPTHFTNPALTLFAARKDSLDIKNMTPLQMTETAADIAGESKLAGKKLRSLLKIRGRAYERFACNAQRNGRQDMGAFLQAVVSELLRSDVYKQEFDAGLEIIRPFMKEVPGAPSALPLNHPEWPNIERALQEKARTVQAAPKKPAQNGLQKTFPYVEHEARRQPEPSYGYGGGSLQDLLGSLFGGGNHQQPRRTGFDW